MPRQEIEKATAREWGLRTKLHEARVRIHDLEEALEAIQACSTRADMLAIVEAALWPKPKEVL